MGAASDVGVGSALDSVLGASTGALCVAAVGAGAVGAGVGAGAA